VLGRFPSTGEKGTGGVNVMDAVAGTGGCSKNSGARLYSTVFTVVPAVVLTTNF